jgi:hypothetical protein
MTPQTEQHIATETHRVLERWHSRIPKHCMSSSFCLLITYVVIPTLKFLVEWRPNHEDLRVFKHSAFIEVYYYHTLIFLHKSFISAPEKASPISLSSLDICIHAARKTREIVETVRERTGSHTPWVDVSFLANLCRSLLLIAAKYALFNAAAILLMATWGRNQSSHLIDIDSCMDDALKCLEFLKSNETRFHSVGWQV